MNEPITKEEQSIDRFDCTNGGAHHCYGCYTMTLDSDGDYVRFDDHERIVTELRASLRREESAREVLTRENDRLRKLVFNNPPESQR